jgi:hypothetical protein
MKLQPEPEGGMISQNIQNATFSRYQENSCVDYQYWEFYKIIFITVTSPVLKKAENMPTNSANFSMRYSGH